MVPAPLPLYPTKGNRQRLDADWLEQLQQQGLAACLPSMPEPPAVLYQGITEFNHAQYWQCHETLEAVWLQTPYPLRLFYNGLIKAAAGMFHVQRHNRRGARRKLQEAIDILAPFTPQCLTIDTASLQQALLERVRLFDTDNPVDWAVIERLPAIQIGTRPRHGGT